MLFTSKEVRRRRGRYIDLSSDQQGYYLTDWAQKATLTFPFDIRLMVMTSDAYTAKLLIAPTVSAIGGVLSELIIESCCKPALHSRGAFTIALSGGSLPSFLQELPSYCRRAGVDPQWEKWHVLLADERCVLSTDAESNLGSIQSNFTNSVC